MNRKSLVYTVFLLMLFVLTSCNTNERENQDTVSVSGTGTLLAQPDMALVNVNFSHIAATTKEAKKVVEETMQRIFRIIKEEGVEEKFVKTVSLNYDVEYEYRNGRRIKIGQRAQQTIVVTITDIVDKPERFPSLLDKITAINNVEISNIRFDIEDKTELFKQSRELAYQKAFDKASQYAELSGRKIGKVLTLSEGRSQDIAQTRVFANNVGVRESAALFDESAVPAGEYGITSEINITFALE